MTPLSLTNNYQQTGSIVTEEKNAELMLVQILFALGDPIRLSIVKHLANDGPLPCKSLKIRCKAPASTITHHLGILKSVGLINSNKDGTTILQSLRYREMNEVFPGLIETILQIGDRLSEDRTYTLSQRAC